MSTVQGWQELNLTAPRRVLIEASAGTGKTFTIAVLYLRFLLGDVPSGDAEALPLRRMPKELLLSTFTVAAAEELRQRVRQRIDDALQYADPDSAIHRNDSKAETKKDSLHDWLDARWGSNANLRTADIHHLRRCWLEMDAAPITTLHALCADILGEEPLLTGQDFMPRQMVESAELQSRAMNALWRELQEDKIVSDWLPKQNVLTRDSLMEWLKPFMQPKREYSVPADYAQELARHDRSSIIAMAQTVSELLNHERLTLKKPGREILESIQKSLQDYRADTPWVFPKSDEAALITEPRGILNGNKHRAGSPIPDEGRFDPIAVLGKIGEANSAAAVSGLIARLHSQMDSLKESLRVRTFDDLLLGVHKALQSESPGSAELADRLFARWPVALIDEFQDTDAVQYEILDRIYRDADGNERGVLGMVGDPKQSIYRFRGSDIEVYSDAVSKVKDNRLLLTHNYRSAPEYIQALNEFHAGENAGFGSGAPFAFEPIEDPKRHAEIGRPALHIYKIDIGTSAKAEQTRMRAAGICADLVQELLESRHTEEGKPITPSDLAILVYKNAEAVRLQKALSQVGVASVIGKGESVFESSWTTEMQLLLASAIYPSNPQRLRALLLSRLFGESPHSIKQMSDARQDALLAQAAHWNSLLQERGVLGMVEAFLASNQERLSARADFDRLHTDLLHLAEMLQVQLAQGAAVESLIGWMQRQRFENESPDDTSRIRRMESEGGKVRIMTVHASKGLEFPYVLLPSAWDTKPLSGNTKETPLVRIPGTFTYRPAFGDAEKNEFKQSRLEEDYRLLYVAMTRASVECHMFATFAGDTPAGDGAFRKRLDHLDFSSTPAIEVHEELPQSRPHWYSPPPVESDGADSASSCPVVEMADITDRLIRAHSFSGLNKRVKHRTERLDSELENRPAADEAAADHDGNDAGVELEPAVDRRDGLWAIRGEQIGNLLHKALELALPQPSEERMQRSLDSAMEFESFRLTPRQLEAMSEPQFREAMLSWLWQVANVQLLADDTLTLRDLPGRAIRRELDFHLSIRTDAAARKTIADRINALRKRGELGRADDWQRVSEFIGSSHMQGFLIGSSDLVFEHRDRYYVLDYKSNVLGGDPANFSPDRIDTLAMRNPGGYWMQAFLYTLVLHRMLRDRLGATYDPQTHLGGAIYVFARGIGEKAAGPRGGIWYEAFDLELLEAADALLSCIEDAA